ncbi:MAG: sugar transferase [Porphyromonadaceae bacterium]|nr:sugar transferase [Porphyromonadaceae bacterium]
MSTNGKILFYKPKLWLIGLDLLLIIISISLVFLLLPLTTTTPFQKYSIPFLLFASVWIILSYLFQRYKKLRSRSFFKHIFSLFYISIIVFTIFGAYILIEPKSPWSQNVLLTVIIGVFLLEYLTLLIYFAYKYATQYEVPELHHELRKDAVAMESEELSEDARSERQVRIIENAGKKAFEFINKNVKWDETGTHILSEVKFYELPKIELYQYSTIIQLKKLNDFRGINRMLAIFNEKLPDDGKVICCYKSQNTTKQNILRRKPKILAYVYYIGHFIIHRIFPKFFLTKRLYYDFTEGKKRILSKTEVLGRLTYCGFKVEKIAKIDNLHYVIAKRDRDAIIQGQRNYGLLIKLKRVGKNNKLFTVYKFRTMHPYAEFIQDYIFEQSNLAEGGKFKNDIRVTTIGKFLRKFWLDELPMFLNLVRGDIKFVGVRPLSKHYFNLYSQELQEKRVKHKPGLLPPFYADMPKTLEEIQNSEMRYLTECENQGTFKTDTKYFFLILKNILFKKARSA